LDDDRVTAFTEKPETPVSNLAIMGIYYVKEVRKLFNAIDRQMGQDIQTQGEFFLADALQMMINEGNEFTTIPATVWEDCGTIKALLAANRFLLSHIEPPCEVPGSVIIPPVYIAPTAKVVSSVVGPHASIGDGVTIEDAIVRDSIVDTGATIESTVLVSSIVGRNAVVRGEPMRVNVGDSSDVDLRSMQENGRG
jgi:glucose-1-phosphate thymidylyltransferase